MPISTLRSLIPGQTWLTGVGAPQPNVGYATQFYLNTATGEVWQKTDGSTWTLRGDLSSSEISQINIVPLDASTTGSINFKELAVNGTNSVSIKAPDNIPVNYDFTLPSTAGTPGFVLATDGSGHLSWVAPTEAAPVTSVNTKTGAVVLTANDVDAIPTAEKGVALGVATLGADGLVPTSQLPPTPGAPVTSVNGKIGDVVLTTTDIAEGTNQYFTEARAKAAAVVNSTGGSQVDQAPSVSAVKAYVAASSPVLSVNTLTGNVVIDAVDVGAVPTAEKGVAFGVATLGGDGKVPSSQLPAAPNIPVTSVNGKIGDVVLTTTDIAEGTNQYFTDARAQTAAVIDSTTGAQLTQAPSVHAVKEYVTNSVASEAAAREAADALLIPLTQKAAPNGVATLGADGKVVPTQLPAAPNIPVTSVNGKIGDVVLTTTDVAEGTNQYFTDVRAQTAAVIDSTTGAQLNQAPSVHAVKEYVTNSVASEAAARDAADALLIPLTQKAAAGGVATLDVTGKIPTSQIPPIAITHSYVVTTIAEMLALGTVHPEINIGDVAVVTDLNETYILSQLPTSVLANWVKLLVSSPVQSVNGQTGTVSLSTTDISEGLNLYYTDLRAQMASVINSSTGSETNKAMSVAAAKMYTDDAVEVETLARQAADALLIPLTQKGAALGVATLGADGLVPSSQLPPAPGIPVTSVNGQIGDVVLTTTDVAEGTNLYFTDGRAQTASVINSSTGSETNKAMSVAAAKMYTDDAVEVETLARQAADALLIPLTQKGAALGVATLGADGLVPSSQLPPAPGAPVTSVNTKTGDVVLNASDVGAIPTAEKGAALGVATLGADGLVPTSQLPPTPGAPVTSVNTKTGAVVLTASDVSAVPTAEKGVALGVATLGADGLVPTSQLPPTPGAPVTSVNTKTGAVVLTASDVGAIPTAEKGVALGVATLGSDGLVPSSQLPPSPGAPVTSVNTKTGAVVLSAGDVGAVSVTGDTMTGILVMGPSGILTGQTGTIEFRELAANGSNYVALRAADSIAANVTWTLPNSDGSTGQVLSTNGSGVLSWVNQSSAPVTSVNGKTGVVVLSASDVGALSTTGGTLSGALAISGSLTLNAQNELRLADGDSSNYVGFKSPATVSANRIWTLPSTDGTSGQVLSTDGSGNLSWVAAGSGGGGVTSVNGLTGVVVIGALVHPTNESTFEYNKYSGSLTGQYNTGIGFYSLQQATSGNRNTAYGAQSLYSNTAGSENIAIGVASLYSNVTGLYNIAIGNDALRSYTSINSIAIGDGALRNSTAPSDSFTGNIAIGRSSMYQTTNGYRNVAIGISAMYSNTSGTTNTAIGYGALYSNTTGFSNLAIGYRSLYNSTASSNTALGNNCLFNNTTGSNNTAIGDSALYSNTTGNYNVVLGNYAASNISNTDNNTVIGYSAMQYAQGSENIIIGRGSISGYANPNINIVIGNGSLNQSVNTSTAYNVVIGHFSVNSACGDYSTYINGGQGSQYSGVVSIGRDSSGLATSPESWSVNNVFALGTMNHLYKMDGKVIGDLTLGYDMTLGMKGKLKFSDSLSNYITLEAPDTISSNTVYKLPVADGTSGQVLSTDGSGNLSWVAAGGSGPSYADLTLLITSVQDALIAETNARIANSVSIADLTILITSVQDALIAETDARIANSVSAASLTVLSTAVQEAITEEANARIAEVKWLYGNGSPSPVSGKDNDFYMDLTGKQIWQKQSGTWILVGTLN